MEKAAAIRNTLISEIQNRLNLVIVVAVLFAGITANLYQIAGDSTKASQGSLYISAYAGIYILVYLLFEIFKKRISLRAMIWLNNSVLVSIGTFIFPILVISLGQNSVINFWIGIPLVATLWALPFTAAVTLTIVIWSLVTLYV